MWGASLSIITKPSFAAPGDPGKLIIKVLFVTPAAPRDKSVVGTLSREYARSASRIPGIFFSINGSVASGVTSSGEIPVPPVVTTKSRPSLIADLIADAIFSMSSGSTSTASI